MTFLTRADQRGVHDRTADLLSGLLPLFFCLGVSYSVMADVDFGGNGIDEIVVTEASIVFITEPFRAEGGVGFA